MKKNLPLAFYLWLFLATAARPQESVDVPQILQENVRAFNLTLDSLAALTGSLKTRAELLTRQLQMMQQRMQRLPLTSRTYQLERRRYEEKLSDFLAQKFATLAEMQSLRQQTLAHLESIPDRLDGGDTTRLKPLREKVRKQMDRNDELLAQTRLEALQLLAQLKKPGLSREQALHLTQKLHHLRADRLALLQANKNRFAVLQASIGQQNEDLPAMRQYLRAIWENLQNGFDWIEAEMAYTQLFSEYRKNWLSIDAQLLEVSSLVERFRDAVMQINLGSAMLKEMEQYEQLLHAPANGKSPDGRSLLPEIPLLNWPGKPAGPEPTRALAPAEADSLEQLLQRDLPPPEK
ncbi:MAG: hypothetical protein ONA90_07935 [candidate division KSB1 bacterium]|nr:hypothetical protein [candidate division KSB1 bacterium]